MTPLRRTSIYAVFFAAAVLIGTAPASMTPAPSVQVHAEREAGLPDVPHLVGRLVRLAVREALRSK